MGSPHQSTSQIILLYVSFAFDFKIKVPIYVITEPMVQGCLKEHLKTDSGKDLSIRNLIDMGAQVGK